MMRTIGCIALLAFCCSARTQNLIPNGGFEDENVCTEYKHNCAPEAWIANSMWANYYFRQADRAAEGEHFVGLGAGASYGASVHNFIRTRLLCGLQPGHQYQLTFYIRSRQDILDSVGVYFSATDFLFEKRNFKQLDPQLWATNALDSLYTDPSLWQKVRFIYTAKGDEGFITIGCFNRKEYKFRGQPDFNKDYYVYLDNVALVPLDKQEQLCPQVDSLKADIYGEDQRHEFLRRQIYVRTKAPPPVTALPKTVRRIPPPPKQRIDTLIVPDIFFATASYQLSPKSYGMLDSFSRKLVTYAIDSVVVEGHTDSVGKLAYNEALSLNRSNSVKEYIVGKLPANKTILVNRGYAYHKPVASNKTPAGRQRNRRVEIYVYRKEPE
jgi:outer membrane protein OmpA-like peptidoglycan-associated protein